MSTLFTGIFEFSSNLQVLQFVICIFVSLLIGVFFAWINGLGPRAHSSHSFTLTLILLPAIECVVIMMVNGNVGAGVAVAGAFSMMRFRSAPGSARDIVMLFMAMGAGLITGMGYLGYAVLFALIIGGAKVAASYLEPGLETASAAKTLRITIPEDLSYSGLFDDLFEKYTTHAENISVRTANMGSMFKLTYDIVLRDTALEKEFIDALRCRNGNLEIAIDRKAAGSAEL